MGPSLALKILSGMSIEELVPAIRKGDLAQLVRIPGVGRKTAERIVVELRDKLAVVDVPEAGKPATRSQLESDVASALVNLGYDERSVEKAIEKARGSGRRRISRSCCVRRCRFLAARPCRRSASTPAAKNSYCESRIVQREED